MRHYEWPQGIIDWKQTKSIYTSGDPDLPTIAPLMQTLGLAMGVKYGTKTTSTQTHSIRPALVNRFAYSPSMFVAGANMTQDGLVRLLRAEMRSGRPAIVCGCSHLWICDGMCNDFLHFNMGWGGEFDGWYRFPSYDRQLSDGKTLLRSALLNIWPLKEPVHKSVTLTSPGQLTQLLSEKECATISSLKVSGPINGADLWLIRRMAGVTRVQDYASWRGTLTDLDLADAQIVTDTAAYEVFDAVKGRFNSTVKGVRYEFAQMTHDVWVQFCAAGGNNSPILRYSELVPGQAYELRIRTMADRVGPWMFDRCAHLRTIRLPRATKSVDYRSFADCHSLSRIVLPQSARVAPDAGGPDSLAGKVEYY